jgi:hypothetical protein
MILEYISDETALSRAGRKTSDGVNDGLPVLAPDLEALPQKPERLQSVDRVFSARDQLADPDFLLGHAALAVSDILIGLQKCGAFLLEIWHGTAPS